MRATPDVRERIPAMFPQNWKMVRSKIPHRRFELQQGALTLDTSAVYNQTAIGADHAMARHNNRQWVLAICQSDGARDTSDFRRLRLV